MHPLSYESVERLAATSLKRLAAALSKSDCNHWRIDKMGYNGVAYLLLVTTGISFETRDRTELFEVFVDQFFDWYPAN